MMTTMNNEDPAEPSVHEPRGRDWPEPVAWVRDLAAPQPHCVTSLRYRSKSDADAGTWYAPLYTADQMRAAIEADRAKRGVLVDVDRMLADCVPGGHSCDPQQVADAIRAWFAR